MTFAALDGPGDRSTRTSVTDPPGATSVQRFAMWFVVGVLLGATLIAGREAFRSLCRQVDLSDPVDGHVVDVWCADAFVVVAPSPRVFWARVPHLPAELLVWDDSTGVFRSPAHGEVFDQSGAPIDGPVDVDRPLAECRFTVEDRTLTVGACPDPSDLEATDLARREREGPP